MDMFNGFGEISRECLQMELCPSWLSPSVSWLQEERRQEVGIWRRGKAEQISRPTTTPLRAQPKPCAFYLELSAGTYASEAALEYTPQCAVQCKTRSRTVKTTSCLPTLEKRRSCWSKHKTLDAWRLRYSIPRMAIQISHQSTDNTSHITFPYDTIIVS